MASLVAAVLAGATAGSMAAAPSATPVGAASSLAQPGVGASGAANLLDLAGGAAWAFDGNGHVLGSADGGAHWQTVFPTWRVGPTGPQAQSAFFLNATDAWVETNHQWPAPPGVTTIWRTADGGAHWHKGISLPGVLSQYGSPFDQFVFADDRHGYGLQATGSGRDVVWASVDGGETWNVVKTKGLPWQGGGWPFWAPALCSADPFALTVVSAHVLMITTGSCPAETPGAWCSTDDGRTWAQVPLGAPPEGWHAAEAWDYPRLHRSDDGAEVLSTRFFDGRLGVLAITPRPGELLVYRSYDAGASWQLASQLQTGSLSRPSGFWASATGTWELPAPSGLYTTAGGGRHWRWQRSALSLPGMAEASFASARSGIGLFYPELGNTAEFLTADGGRSWPEATMPTVPAAPQEPFNALQFATPTRGWAAGTAGVAGTTDGGRSWSHQLSTPEPVEELSFAGPEEGWALTSDELFGTSDGGLHWSVLAETPLGAFSSVQRTSAGFGTALVCERDGTRAVVTYDGGQSWRQLPAPRPDDLLCGQVEGAGTGYGLCFGGSQDGWAVLASPNASRATVERTTDGGLHWSVVATFEPMPEPLACQGSSQAWVGLQWMENMAEAGDLAGTTDGGRTWGIGKYGRSPFNTPRVTPADRIPTRSLGTAEGSSGALWEPAVELEVPGPGDVVDLWANGACQGLGIITTTDSGASWTDAPPRARATNSCETSGLPFIGFSYGPMPAVSFPDSQDGFVLGPAAVSPSIRTTTSALIGTTDGGQHWQLLTRFDPSHLLGTYVGGRTSAVAPPYVRPGA